MRSSNNNMYIKRPRSRDVSVRAHVCGGRMEGALREKDGILGRQHCITMFN